MTFVVSLVSRDTIWLAADRRISWADKHSDHGVKIMTMETSDGVAILGYAGLGETPQGNQPSEWMADVLRGFNLSMDEALWKLAHEIQQHLLAHLLDLGNHLILVPAFVDGESRVYGVGLSEDGQVGYTKLRLEDPLYPAHLSPAPPRVMYTGSGGNWFAKRQLKRRWVRELCSLTKQHDARRISDYAMSDRLAALNLQVSHSVDNVSPDCVVVWLRRPGSKLPISGQQSYEGVKRVRTLSLPSVATDPEGPALGRWIFDHTHTLESDLSDGQCSEALRFTSVVPREGSSPLNRDNGLR